MNSRVFTHASIYSVGNFFVTAAGFITFPILTRVFSVADYGVLNLVSAALLFLVALGKLGLQHAVLRLYSEMRAKSAMENMEAFVSTVLLTMLAAGSLVAVLWSAGVAMAPEELWGDIRIQSLFLLTAALIPIRVLDSGLLNILRAQQRSTAITVYSIARKYGGILLIVAVLFGVSQSLWGFYWATIATEFAALVFLARWVMQVTDCHRWLFSKQVLRALLAFGIPMIGYELSGILLLLGDRYVLQGLLGAEAVGIYSAAYNLCQYVEAVLIAGIAQAVMPGYLQIWEEQGPEATAAFLGRFLRIYSLACIPIAAGLAAVGEEVLTVLASSKYTEGASIIPLVIAGMAINGVTAVTGASLYIHKKSLIIVGLVSLSAIINITLNVVLIPRFGIMGAALATFAAYLILTALSMIVGSRWLNIRVPYFAILKYGALALVMYYAVRHIAFDDHLATLVARILAGAVLYAAMALLTDAESRNLARAGMKHLGIPFDPKIRDNS